MASRPGTYSNPLQPGPASGTTPIYPYYYPNAYPTQKPRSKSKSKKRHSSKHHHKKQHHRKEEEGEKEERGVIRKVGHHLKEHKWVYLFAGTAAGAGYYMWQKRKDRERTERGVRWRREMFSKLIALLVALVGCTVSMEIVVRCRVMRVCFVRYGEFVLYTEIIAAKKKTKKEITEKEYGLIYHFYT